MRPPRWRVWWADLRSLAGPVLAYWAAVLVGVGLFCGLWVFVQGVGGTDDAMLAALVAATVVGTGLGQLCAVTRVRTWVVLAVAFVTYLVLTTAVTAFAVSDAKEVGVALVIVGFFLPFFALAGLLSLRTSVLSVLALFTPLTWTVGAILFAAENIGKGAERWFAGQKFAVWDVLTAPMLVVGIGLSLGYLALRERHRLHRWMTAPSAGDTPTIRRVSGSSLGAAAAGCGTLVTGLVLVLVVSFGTGLVAPYLWRSAPADDGVERPSRSAPQPRAGDEPAQGPQPQQTAQEVAQKVGISLVFLMVLVLATLLSVLVFGPPARRLLLLQALRRPPPLTPPTERVRNAWRLCEVALADAGVERLPGDSATAMVARARPRLPDGLNLEPLDDVAAIADRGRFGLGLDPADEMRARRNAEMAYQAVWEVLSEWDRVRAVYRWTL